MGLREDETGEEKRCRRPIGSGARDPGSIIGELTRKRTNHGPITERLGRNDRGRTEKVLSLA